jgi:hypothetical protein
MCDAGPGRRWSVALDPDKFGTGTTCPGLGRRGWVIPSHAGHVRAIDAGGRRSPVDGAVGVDSLVAFAAVALLAPSALGLLPRLLVPAGRAAARTRDQSVRARYRHARRRAGPGRRRSRVRVRSAGYEISLGRFSEEAGRRAAAADSPQSGSRSRPAPTVTTRKPTASTWPVKDRSTTPHSPVRQARIERSRARSSSPGGPDSPDSPNRAQSAN